MTAALSLNHLVRMSAESMLNGMIEGLAIGLFAWILLRVIGRRNSSTRFAVWFSALLAITALPLLGIAASGSATGRVASAITVPSSWAFDILIVWASIAGISLLRVAVGVVQLRKLRASYTAIDPATLDPLLQETLGAIQVVRPVTLCRSDGLHVPTAIGFLRPVVVIPSWALQELSTAELNSILIHELAHLRRRDDWTNLAQQILKALLFFHPAVWWIESQLALEREMACDDAVLAATRNPKGYAQCLVSMAEKSFLRRGLALAQAAVHRMRHTSLRVSQILDTNRPVATRIWKPALYSVAAFLAVCLISLSHAPELVAFQDRMPDANLASVTSPRGALISSGAPNFLETQAVATPVSFRAKSAGVAGPQSSEYRIQGRLRSLARKTAYRVRKRMNSPLSLRAAYRIPEPTNPPAPQSAEYRQSMNSPVLRVAEFRIWEGASFLIPQSAANNPGLQLLKEQVSREASSTTISQAILTQTIFVVKETLYDEAPRSVTITVWRVTVLDSTRNPAESRIPAKQI